MAPGTERITVAIEEVRGGSGRHRIDPGTGAVEKIGEAPPLWPAHYGYVEGTLNPADGDPVDCLVLGDFPVEPGGRIEARPVGVMRREDGDDKVLAVVPEDPQFGSVRDLAQVPARVLEELDAAFRPYFLLGPWEDAASAKRFLSRCRKTKEA